MSGFLAALREQVNGKGTLGAIAGLGVLTVLADVTVFAVFAFGGVFVLTAIVNALAALPGVKGRALSAVVFAFGALCGLWLTLTESSYVMGGFTLVVAWLALDALYDTRNGIERDPGKSDLDGMSATEASRMMYRAGKVQQALDRSPASLSVSELVTRTDLSEAEVRDALVMLRDADAISEHRERYEIDENQPGPIRSTVRRLARPFTLFTPSR